MIGEPTNFKHTGHIGSGDVEMGNSHLNAIQTQMQGKGGYDTAFTVKVRGVCDDIESVNAASCATVFDF